MTRVACLAKKKHEFFDDGLFRGAYLSVTTPSLAALNSEATVPPDGVPESPPACDNSLGVGQGLLVPQVCPDITIM